MSGGIEEGVDDEGVIEPAGDLATAAVDETGAAVVVAEQVVPDGEPVVRVPAPVRQQLLRILLAPKVDRTKTIRTLNR